MLKRTWRLVRAWLHGLITAEELCGELRGVWLSDGDLYAKHWLARVLRRLVSV